MLKLNLIMFISLIAFAFAMSANAGVIEDSDTADGSALLGFAAGTPSPDLIPDVFDNCLTLPNGPLQEPNNQIDSDNDGCGNRCDADYNQTFDTVDFDDFVLFLAAFGGPGLNIFDHNFSGGVIDFDDFSIFLQLFGGPPGPGPFCK